MTSTIELTPPRNSGSVAAFAFERAAQVAEKHRSENRVVQMVAQWEVLLTIFKHGVEIAIKLFAKKLFK